MGEYNITKVIDGLFVSDQSVPLDPTFLASNKVIRILGWTALQTLHSFDPEDLQQFHLPKNLAEVRFPRLQELEEGFTFLQEVHQEMLCGLIYSESELEAALIGIMYLMRRFQWDCNTAYAFMKAKMEMFQFSDQAIDGLETYERELKAHLQSDLSHVLWEFDFLAEYQPRSEEEALIVCTIKNKLRGCQGQDVEVVRQKKTKRIRWSDQIRPSSPFSLNSAKNIPRSSLLKGRLASPPSVINMLTPALQTQLPNSKDLQLLYQSVGFKNSPASTNTRGRDKKNERDNTFQENQDYLQLKQLSRTNFNDCRNYSKQLRRRSSLKPTRKEPLLQKSSSTTSQQSINTLIGIYSGRGVGRGLCKSSSGQNFLSGLRACNKLSVVNV